MIESLELIFRAVAKKPVEAWWPAVLNDDDVAIHRRPAGELAFLAELDVNEALYSPGGVCFDWMDMPIKTKAFSEWARQGARSQARHDLLRRAGAATVALLRAGHADAVNLIFGDAPTLDAIAEDRWLRVLYLLESAVEYW